MRQLTVIVIIFSILIFSWDCLASGTKKGKRVDKKNLENAQLLNRIDFGNSYILGQTFKSGAVYLLQRKKSEIKSMLEYRKDYRKEILEDFVIQDISRMGEKKE